MNLLHKVRRLEADMTRAVERAAERWSRSGAREPLEIAQAIVDYRYGTGAYRSRPIMVARTGGGNASFLPNYR